MKYLLVIFLLIFLVAGGVAAWMWYGMTHAYQGFAKEGVFVDVPHGVSSRYVAYILKKMGSCAASWLLRFMRAGIPSARCRQGNTSSIMP